MKYLLQLSILGLITLISELLSYFIPLPVPAGIYGLIILFICLVFKIIRLEWVEDTADFLLVVMPVMFVPAIVSLINAWDSVREHALGVVVTSVISTVIVMAVSGMVTQAVIRIRKRKRTGLKEGKK